jgi:DNA-directed RNA polymerase subunit RPC12/RpoP
MNTSAYFEEKMGLVKKFFCDKCGRELKGWELIQLLEYDLCADCRKEIVKT